MSAPATPARTAAARGAAAAGRCRRPHDRHLADVRPRRSASPAISSPSSGCARASFSPPRCGPAGASRASRRCSRSAELLRSPALDLIQIHNLLDWRTHLATLRRMKEEGRVRYIGITHYTTGRCPSWRAFSKPSRASISCRCGYSLDTRDAETRLLPVAAERGVAVIVNQPFETGGMFRRVRGRRAAGLGGRIRLRELGAAFPEILMADPAVTCVIPATGKPEHMADNLKAGFGRLPDAGQREQIRQLWDLL